MDNEDKIMIQIIRRKNGTAGIYLSEEADYNILLASATNMAEIIAHRYEISIEQVSELMIDLAKRVPFYFWDAPK